MVNPIWVGRSLYRCGATHSHPPRLGSTHWVCLQLPPMSANPFRMQWTTRWVLALSGCYCIWRGPAPKAMGCLIRRLLLRLGVVGLQLAKHSTNRGRVGAHWVSQNYGQLVSPEGFIRPAWGTMWEFSFQNSIYILPALSAHAARALLL